MEADRDDAGADKGAAEQLVCKPDHEHAVTGGGPLEQTYTDTGAAGTPSSAPPAVERSGRDSLPAEPQPDRSLRGCRDPVLRLRRLKAYPNPTSRGARRQAYPAGSTFTDGTGQAIPRYPTNIYYNASTEAEEVDEFNALYTPVPRREMRSPADHHL